ncbi:endonuclease/exonuclease/phosphatase family protein [Simkania sp.]|uniref:endonuclease/exonuclease/phosphatase family protein n=1 Tax=Simkania sp. TaxID=34094 RepID=UPI003B52E3D5
MSVEVAGDGVDNFLILTQPTTTETIVDKVKGTASYLMMPFWEAETAFQYCLLSFLPDEYGQEATKAYEYAKRFFIAPLSLAGMGITFLLEVSGRLLTGVARIFESRNYRYLSGNAEERSPEKPKFMHLNFCGLYGGLPYSCGGTTPGNARIGELAERVRAEDLDLLFLCECNRMLTPALYYNLRDDFSHFFVDIGLNTWGIESCQFVASRVPIISAPSFHPYSEVVEGEEWHMMRGFFAVETADKWYLYTHLHSGNDADDREMRQRELGAIQDFIVERTADKPCVLLGDLNINRLDESNDDYQKMLGLGFKDGFPDQHPAAFTGSDMLDHHIKKNAAEAPPEVLDYILVNDKGTGLELQLSVLETYKPQLDQSLSDHKGLIGV